jgi:hypothetical protein
MKKLFLTLAFMLISSFAFANTSTTNFDKLLSEKVITVKYDDEVKSCTVSYTNSYGVTFTSTARTCTEAYENLSMHIEAQ